MSYDFGDAPIPFPTTLEENGARHAVGGPWFLGTSIDIEDDGQPDEFALGDDESGDKDEDGISFETKLVKGRTAEIQVTTSQTGFLNAWLDANGDGDWTDVGEHILTGQPIGGGPTLVSFDVPMTTTPGEAVEAAAVRFRFSTQAELSFDGSAIDGEVEDYVVPLDPINVPDWGARVTLADASVVEGDVGLTSLSFEVTLSIALEHPVTLAYTTADDSALAGVDYIETIGEVVIPAGEVAAQIVVPVIGDFVDESNEILNLHLTAITGAEIGRGLADGTIFDDDNQFDGNRIRGQKWLDLNTDGVMDPDEPRLPGVTIYADVDGNRHFDVGEPFAISREDDSETAADETGTYEITGVPSGRALPFVR